MSKEQGKPEKLRCSEMAFEISTAIFKLHQEKNPHADINEVLHAVALAVSQIMVVLGEGASENGVMTMGKEESYERCIATFAEQVTEMVAACRRSYTSSDERFH